MNIAFLFEYQSVGSKLMINAPVKYILIHATSLENAYAIANKFLNHTVIEYEIRPATLIQD